MLRPRALAFLAPALLFALAAAAPALAQEKHKLGVSIGFRGLGSSPGTIFAKPRHFIPVTVVLTNGGQADVEGTLRVYRSVEPPAGVDASEEPEQGLFYERPVKIPRGGKRTEELYYYCQDREPNRLCVAFQATSGETVSAHPKLELRANEILGLSLTSADSDEAVRLSGATVGGARRDYDLTLKTADPGSLPERPEGYGAFDMVVLSDLDPRSVSERQAQALAAWVQGGGDLIVAFSGKASEGMGGLDVLDKLLPVDAGIGPPVERDLHALELLAPDSGGALERVPVAVRPVVPRVGARIVAGTKDAPLIVTGRAGAGRVTYIAFPIAALRTWNAGAKEILGLLTHPPAEDLDSVPPAPASPPLEEVLLNLTETRQLDPPSALIVGPLLILYVALVAPLNYIVLSRFGKKDYAMVGATVIALLFGGLFYGIGWYYKGTRALVTRAAIIDMATEPGGLSRIDGMNGFYSTDQGVLDGKVPPGATVGPIAERMNDRGGHVVEPASGDPFLRSIELATWSLRRFRTTRLSNEGAVVSHLRYEGGTVVGEVENKTKLVIETPTIYAGERVIQRVPDLKPGETWHVDETPGELPPGEIALTARILRGLGQQGYKARYGIDGTLQQSDPFANDPRGRVHASLQRRASAVLAGPGTLPALFVGVAEHDPRGMELDASASIELSRCLVLAESAVEAPKGELRFGALRPIVTHSVGYDPAPNGPGSPARLGPGPKETPGAVTYEWRLPASRELPFKASKLEITCRFVNTPDAENSPTLWVFIWEDRKWRQVAFLKNQVSPWPADPKWDFKRYVDPRSGVMRARIESTSLNELFIDRVTLSVSGSRAEPEEPK